MTPVRRRCKTVAAALSSALAAAALLATGHARADEVQGRTSSLSWVRLEGAESCIGTQPLAQAVEKRLARKVFVSATEADVSVEGHVARTTAPRGWRAVLTIRDASGKPLGTREVDSAEAECSALDEPIVFIVSVLIDPEAETRAPTEPEAEPPPPAAAPPPKVVVRRERVLVPVVPPDPWRVEASAGATGGVGLLPSASLGVTAEAMVEPPSFWGILLSGTYWLGVTVDAERDARSEVSLAYGGLGLCPIRWSQWRASYRVCAGVGVGSLRSRGVGFDTEKADETLAAHVFLPNRFGLALVGPLVATLGLTLLVPLARTELTYRAADGSSRVLFQPSPIAGAADLGLALHFPR
jgi:hypothetical protein